MTTTGWVVLGVLNLPVYFGLGWVLFRTWQDFWDSIRFWITPDIFSLFRGEFLDDWFAELKLGVWIAACAGCVFGEAYLFDMLSG